MRAAALPDAARPAYAVIVDVPLTAKLAAFIRDDTGITIGDITAIAGDDTLAAPVIGRSGDIVPVTPQPAIAPPSRDGWFEQPLTWVSFLDFADWDTGRNGTVSMAIGMSPAEIYRRVSAAPVRFGTFSFDQVLLLLLTMIAGAFFVIQVIALVMGLGLARSITGSVHELFVGTGRIRQGDFTHKIPIRTRDQLGELADSFNSMTTSIEGLLQEKAEKERLEQELRIARSIQMSLLPQGQVRMPGLALAAHCEPAREVGGDYYDFLPLDEHRLAVLIADVSGKGTSAALYMAELKGLMLSLSRRHGSPRELLIEANRIISEHLDTRSFITMIYAVVDMQARTFTYARAGHCPVVYVPGPRAAATGVRILAPDGLVLGLKLDRGELFERLLKEDTLALTPGDLIVLYTDGISESLEMDDDTSGEVRLGQIVAQHRALPPEELRERVLREVAAVAGSAAQHDDMTMLLLKVEEIEGFA